MIPGYYPISLKKWLTALVHINRLMRIVFDRAQSTQRKIWTSAPTADDLDEREFAFFDDETDRRIYTKLGGTVRYWDLT